jgi:DNA repair exonuclease SbcCD nuclease subunit
MASELTRLNNELKEKEKFLQQGNDSVKEFIKDKIGIVKQYNKRRDLHQEDMKCTDISSKKRNTFIPISTNANCMKIS